MKVMTLDLETSNLDPWKDKIILIGYKYDDDDIAHVIKYDAGERPNEKFRQALSDSNITKRGHNLLFDLLFLSVNGYSINGPLDDTRVLLYLEDPEQKLGLKDNYEKRFHCKAPKLEDIGVKRLNKRIVNHPKLAENIVRCGKVWVARETLRDYNASDVIYCNRLKETLVETKWYKEVEQPLSSVLLNTEIRGIQLDIPYFERLKNEFQEKTERLKKEIGEDINLNSPKQVLALFKHRFNTALASTDKHTIKLLSWSNDRGAQFAKVLLEYRRVSKLLNTYVEPLLEQADSAGRIHGRFNQAGREGGALGDTKGTATGRLSSSEPNLQNIPDRTSEGRSVRRGFIATPGMILIDSDLKQIEPRLIAHFSQSKVLLNAYDQSIDTHAVMGGLIFNKEPDRLTALERFVGKTGWLASVYGCSYKKIRKIVELNSDEPIFNDDYFYERVQTAFWRVNPEIWSWVEQLVQRALNLGYVETIGGRRIKIKPADRSSFAFAEFSRKAVNYLIQGSAADIMKMIIIQLAKVEQLKLLATVHDEVLLESDKAESDAVFIHHTMCSTVKLKNVTLEADSKVMQNWAEK